MRLDTGQKMNQTLDASDALVEWVEENVFGSRVYDKKSIARIATKSSEKLGLDITDDMLVMAISVVSKEKNFDLDRYQFK